MRAHAQFQGALALITGAASRGALAPAALATAVTSLSAIDPDPHGDYDGRLVRWLAAFVDELHR